MPDLLLPEGTILQTSQPKDAGRRRTYPRCFMSTSPRRIILGRRRDVLSTPCTAVSVLSQRLQGSPTHTVIPIQRYWGGAASRTVLYTDDLGEASNAVRRPCIPATKISAPRVIHDFEPEAPADTVDRAKLQLGSGRECCVTQLLSCSVRVSPVNEACLGWAHSSLHLTKTTENTMLRCDYVM